MHKNLDRKIWIYTLLIISMGLISLYSAAYQNVRVPHKIFYDQLFSVIGGLAMMYGLSKVDYRRFYDVAYVFYIANVVLLIWVLISGRLALGAQRWIAIGGFSFQPSEMMKLSLILVLGRYFSTRRPTLSFTLRSRTQELLRDLIIPLVMTLIPAFLIFKQPDLGTAILLFGIFWIVLFLSGLEYRHLIIFMTLCLLLLPLGWNVLKPYQKDRLMVFLNPNIDPLGAGYTIIQSKIAVGSGQLFGKGWLAGTQNQLNFLPERHTDFIFSVIGEEWGLMGTLILLACYFGLISCAVTIAEQVKDKFGMLVASGIIAILSLQVIINIGMVLGLFPIVGITLPFISYGRTSLIIFIIMAGFLLNLSNRRTIF